MESAHHALSGAAGAAEAKLLELRFETQFYAPLELEGDEAGYRRILRTLLDNAVKFTATAPESVQMSSERPQRNGGRGRLCLRVEDTGPEISSA